ncbi:MAG TPA: transcriptional activator NhaR [Candidatus Competibacteraceae bacterium]|nr:transcriptional activator NhaR [Candidatus Competibacteraceae bacterium]
MNLKHLFYFWKAATAGSIARAGEELKITPHTISGQIQLLEQRLGAELFVRQGRKLELTEAGKLALGYAEEIFSLQAELEETIRLYPDGRPMEFRVGVADAVPKSLAYRLLEPAVRLPTPVKIICQEWKIDSLLSELAVHRLDLVIADAPIPQTVDVRAYNHRLGESGLSFFASPTLAQRCDGGFPHCLEGMPMLLPGPDSAIRLKLLRWLERQKITPRCVGEFDGSSLMTAFGEGGVGVFVAPTVLEQEIQARHEVEIIGRSREVLAEYFAISVQRRLTHPCVLAITDAARRSLLPTASTEHAADVPLT